MDWSKSIKLMRYLIGNSNSVKLSIKEQIILFASVKDFLKNGFNLKEAFNFCSLIHPVLKAPLHLIKRRLAQGKSFAEGLKSLVDYKIYYQIMISELHGDLTRTLVSVNEFLKMKQRQKVRLRSLMVYPAFLLIMLIGIMVAIHILVAPQIQGLNDSDSNHHYLWWALICSVPLILLGYGFWRYYSEQDRIWQLNFFLKIPWIGMILRSYYAYYLSNNLALMLNCGMDLREIVYFMDSFRSNILIRQLSHDVKSLVDRGGSLSCLINKYHFLSREMMMLIDSGDTRSVLAQKLNSYSKLEFKLMIKRSSRLISLLQPIMFLIIGLVITGTYLSMLLPMYNSIKGVY